MHDDFERLPAEMYCCFRMPASAHDVISLSMMLLDISYKLMPPLFLANAHNAATYPSCDDEIGLR